MTIETLCLSLIEKTGAGIMASYRQRVELCSPLGWTWIASGNHDLISGDLDGELAEDLLMGLEECQDDDCPVCGLED